MSDRFDVPMDAVLPPAKDAQAPIVAEDDAPDLTTGRLAVRAVGEVLMGSPVDFGRAG